MEDRPLSPTHVQALHDFARFVDNNLSHGHDVLGNKRQYLSRAAHQRYWVRPKLRAVAHEPLPLDTIRSEYLGVFSMLAYCNHLQYLKPYFLSARLNDQRFPLLERPAQWPHAPVADELWAKVQEHQNFFFPLVFSRHLSDHAISPDRVLPIAEMTMLREGDFGEANVYKIKVDSAYNELVGKDPDGEPTQDTFALKVQPSRSAHKNEVTAFTHFQNYPSAHIIGCHGSFIQSGKYCLILEYVDGGNLQTFMQRTPPPQTPEERLIFWKSYSGYLKGIHGVHQFTQSADDGAFKGLHGDIKPDNMLLKMGRSGSPYDFIAKIADFGYSHFRRVDADGQDSRGLDRHGNQQYCAPEASHHILALEAGPNRIDFTADIFSLGAVTCEVVAWMAFGSDAITHYFDIRKQATDKIDCFRGSGYGGCFHNGIVPLQEVSDMHKRIRDGLPAFDHITRKMLELVEEKMLLGRAQDRSAASDIEKQFEIYHQEAAEMMTPRQLPSSQLPILVSLPPSPPTSSPSQNNRLCPPFSCPPTSLEIALATSPAPTSNGHDQPVPTGACTPPTSPIPDSQQSSPLGRPQLAMSTSLNGVHTYDGTKTEHIRPGPSPTVRDTHSNPATESFTTDASCSGSTISRPHGASGTLQPHLTVEDPSGRSGRTSTSSARIRPFLTLEQLRDYYKHRKYKSPIARQLIDDIQRLQKYIKGRDHMFYFDDSDSMNQFKGEAQDAFTLMSYVAKQVDKDGIEVVFGSNSTQVIKKTRTTALLKKLQAQKFDEPRDKMAHNFDTFVRKVLVPRLSAPWGKDLSVLIFTDGGWGDETEMASGVERAVKHLMEEIVRQGLSHTRVILSFVRFGDDELGKKRLSYLDDFGKEQIFKNKYGGNQTCDNVDTGSVNGNICKLFIGSLIDGNDNEDEYPGVISPSTSAPRGT